MADKADKAVAAEVGMAAEGRVQVGMAAEGWVVGKEAAVKKGEKEEAPSTVAREEGRVVEKEVGMRTRRRRPPVKRPSHRAGRMRAELVCGASYRS